eukprot:CAMPEP_0115024398 /NCGR_PEP_ID=MMETSP0216-20121206/33189_1 /TAXON_ID=223996 /ORGANISM="Protocruzia adherens, Strain Boccale" /LENGTH=71 /DNA_ID=CAMNT_0002398399 /DNA_START=53 /DNA_END=268 /DNA_ORIENTATION=-
MRLLSLVFFIFMFIGIVTGSNGKGTKQTASKASGKPNLLSATPKKDDNFLPVEAPAEYAEYTSISSEGAKT